MRFLYILLALAILLFMIMIHELGHYLAGKLLRFKINEFSIGLGPKIVSKKLKNGEVFSLRAIPLGGYCAFMGEDEIVSGGTDIVEKNNEQANNKFFDKKGRELLPMDRQSVLNRIIMLVSGAAFNLASAVIFSFIFIAIVGYAVPKVSFTYNTPNAPLFEEGDKIVGVNGKDVGILSNFSELMERVKLGDTVNLEVVRNDSTINIAAKKSQFAVFVVQSEQDLKPHGLLYSDDIILEVNGVQPSLTKSVTDLVSEAQLGVPIVFSVARVNYELAKIEIIDVSLTIAQYNDIFEQTVNRSVAEGLGISTLSVAQDVGIGYAAVYSVPFTGKLSWTLLSFFGKMFVDRTVFENLSGPVTTVLAIADNTRENIMSILILMPLIAANLGIFNLLPIPALDGSKVVFCIVEAIRKKPLNRNLEAWIHFVGFVAILGLVILVEFLHLLR